MRSTLTAFIAAAMLTVAPAAFAAPPCLHRNGVTLNCGVPGATPVVEAPQPELDANEWFALIALVGGLFALIALMPKFDGAHGNVWDRQEGDE